MCSQECMAKMKILCLNTVQVLFKDAFDRFSSDMVSRNLTKPLNDPESGSGAEGALRSHPIASGSELSSSGLSAKPDASKSKLDHQQSTDCQRASTSFDDPNNNDGNCLNCSSDEHPANDQNCQNQLNNRLAGQLNSQQSGQQVLASQFSGDRRSLSQLVLCNLMQNLVDTINEQCVKQLPGQLKGEKKKRKRKRKRKKSKASEIPDDPPNELERTPMRRMQSFTNDQLRPADKISADNSCSSMEPTDCKHKRAPGDEPFVRVKCSKYRQSRSKSNSPDDVRKSDLRPDERVRCSSTSSGPIKGDESKRTECCSHGSHQRNLRLPGTSNAANSDRLPANRQQDERCLKRKRDESPSYKERRRITSARKRPTTYKRKRPSSDSSSCSDGSSASSSDGSSSDNEFSKDD